MTCFCKDKKAYLEGRKQIGKVWQDIIGKVFFMYEHDIY